MYLSKVSLDISNPSARQAIVNCNDMHRNLIRAFDVIDGEASPRMEGDILYRLTRLRSGYEMLVMSRDLPDWQRLTRYGYVCAEHGTKDLSMLRSTLVRGRVLRFALLASPSKKVASGGKNSKRVFLCTEKERAEWLERQGEKYGFSLTGFREAALPFDVSGQKSGMEIQYRAVEFTGLWTITDERLFWKGYTEGVGPGKAYGLGMIVIACP
jgi:CRISPR system Cascade subunit CasE